MRCRGPRRWCCGFRSSQPAASGSTIYARGGSSLRPIFSAISSASASRASSPRANSLASSARSMRSVTVSGAPRRTICTPETGLGASSLACCDATRKTARRLLRRSRSSCGVGEVTSVCAWSAWPRPLLLLRPLGQGPADHVCERLIVLEAQAREDDGERDPPRERRLGRVRGGEEGMPRPLAGRRGRSADAAAARMVVAHPLGLRQPMTVALRAVFRIVRPRLRGELPTAPGAAARCLRGKPALAAKHRWENLPTESLHARLVVPYVVPFVAREGQR